MSRVRMIGWGLGLLLATPVLARQWTEQPPAKNVQPSPVPPQFQGRPVVPAVAYGVPTGAGVTPASGTSNQATFRPVYTPPSAPAVPPAAAPPNPLMLPPVAGGPELTVPARPSTPKPPPSPSNAATPSVLIEKRCPESVNFGSTLVYEICVRNVGTTPVQQVRVEDELPSGAHYVGGEPSAEVNGDHLSWPLGGLEPNSERRLRVEVQPSGEGEVRSTATVSFSAAAAMRSVIVRPKLTIAMSGPEQALAGDPVPFQIQVANPGTGPVQNLVVRVKLPSGLQHPNGTHIEAELGTLAAGETKTLPLRTTAATGGIQAAEVLATGEGVPEAASRAQVSVMQAQLQLKRNGPAKIMFKGELAEEFEIANPGNAAANNVAVVEVLPAGLEFVTASDGAVFDPATRSVTWKLGQAPANAQRILTLKAKGTAVGEHLIRTVATAERGLEARAEGAVAVEGIPALALEVMDLEDPIEVGGELTYEVRVVNQGSCPCTNIQIQATAPEGLSPTDGAGPTGHRVSGQQVIFEPLAKLATKADVVYRIKVRGGDPGDYRFKVQMTCDQLRGPVNKEESSRVYKN